jgi:peptide/nickel transport system substrate-binding protein
VTYCLTDSMGEADTTNGSTVARIVAAVVALGLVALSACGLIAPDQEASDDTLVLDSYANVEQSDDAPSTGGYLRYGLPFETNSWNPGLAQWGAHSMQVARAIFDPLFEYDEHGDVRPFLLERAEHNADYTQWTLVLRPGITFHNGRRMTATDVSRVAQQLIASGVTGSAWAINDLSGAQILDERTLVVSSIKPWVTLPHQSASQLGFVPDPDWMESANWSHPIGSGPFVVDHWQVGTRLVVQRNPDYWRTDRWGNQLPYLDRVDFDIETDDRERAEMLREGELDVLMQTAPGAGATRLIDRARNGEIQLITDDRGETAEDFVLFNTQRPGLSDVDARRALATAVDRQAASTELTNGVNPPAAGMYEPGSPWFVPTNYPSHDPDRARNLLREVETRRGSGLSFTLKGPDTPDGLRAMQFVQAQWAAVGVDVRIEAVALSKMLITMVLGDFDALLMQHFDYPNPAPELVFVNPAQAKPPGQMTLSFSRIKDDGITQAIDGALHSLDAGTRQDAIALLQRRLDDLVPYIWLVHSRRHIAARPGVMNLVHHTLPDGTKGLDFLLGSHRLDQVWLRD